MTIVIGKKQMAGTIEKAVNQKISAKVNHSIKVGRNDLSEYVTLSHELIDHGIAQALRRMYPSAEIRF